MPETKNKKNILTAFFFTGLLALGGILVLTGFFDTLAAKIDKTNLKPVISINLPEGQSEGQDFWVWIRTYDKYSLNKEKNTGVSKKGDIVAIQPATDQYYPTPAEQGIWSVIKVSGLTPEDRQRYTQAWMVEDTESGQETNQTNYQTLAYRRYKLDVDALGLKPGLDPNSKNALALKRFAYQKDNNDLARYEKGRKIQALKTAPKRYALKLKNYLIPPSAATTEAIACVNGNSDAACNGSEDYNTLTLWEDDTDDTVEWTLVASAVIAIAYGHDDDGSLDDDEIYLNGATTNSTYYRKVTAPAGERHDGTVGGTQGFTIDPSGTTTWYVIRSNESYDVIEWLRIKNVSVYGGSAHTTLVGLAGAPTYGVIRNCIIHDFTATGRPFSVLGEGATGTYTTNNYYYIYNNIVIDISNNTGSAYNVTGILVNANHTLLANNTVYNIATLGAGGSAYGIRAGTTGKSPAVVNNVVVASEDADFYHIDGPWNEDTGYNACDTASVACTDQDFTGEMPNLDYEDLFKDLTANAEDLHLASTTANSIIIDTASSTLTLFSIDIDNDNRPYPIAGDWDIGADEEDTASATFDISGTVYNTNGSTAVTGKSDTVNVRVYTAGVLQTTGTAESNSGTGAYTVSLTDADVDSGDIIVVYLDGEAETANVYTVTDGSTDITDLNLIDDELIIRNDKSDTTAITNTILDYFDNTGGDADMLYDVDAGVLTMEPGNELNIATAGYFTPGGNVTVGTGGINIVGTWTATGSETIANGGNWANSGTFTSATGVVTFNPSSGTATITTGGTGATQDFYDLTINTTNSAIVQLTTNDCDIDGALTITAGTFDLNGKGLYTTTSFSNTGTLKLQGSENISWSTNDTNSGTWEYAGDGTGAATAQTIKDFGANDYFKLKINDTSASNKDTFSLGAAVDINDDLELTLGTFSVGGSNYAIDIASGWTDTGAGAFTEGTGTVTFSGTGEINSNEAFNNVTLNTSGTITLEAALDVNGNLTITNGTLDVSTGNLGINVGGDWSNSGTFTERSGTVTFDGAAAQAISNAETWNNLTINNSAGSPSDSVDVDPAGVQIIAGTLTVTDGQYTPYTGDDYVNVTIETNGIMKPDASAAITVSGDWTNSGTFTHNNSDFTFDGSGAQAITGATTWDNLTINNSAGSPSDSVDVDPAAKQTIAGLLNVSDGQWTSATTDDYASVTIGSQGILKPDASASITASGNWTTTGTFTHNSGTVTFDGSSGTQTINAGASSFYNVTINNSGTSVQLATNNLTMATGGTLTLTTGTLDLNALTLTLGNDITVTDGILAIGTGTLTGSAGNYSLRVEAGGTVTQGAGTLSVQNLTITDTTGYYTCSGNSSINVDGDLAIKFTAHWAASSSTITMTAGDGNVTINSPLAINNLTINSGSNSVQLSSSSLSIADGGVLTMTSGTLDLNALTLTLGADTSISGGVIAIGTGTFDGSASNYDLTVGTGATVTQGTGTLSIQDLTISGTGAYTCSGNSALNVDGNLAISSANWTPDTSTITMTAGDGNVTINSSKTLYNLTLNSSNNFDLNTNGLTLNNSATLTKQGSGDLDTNALALTLGNLTLSAGTINTDARAGTWDLAGNVDIAAGTLKATSGAFTVGGNWTTTGTFTHNSGSVTFDSSAAQTITGATTWNNLTISNSSSPSDSNDVDPDAIQTVAGTLTISDGQWTPYTGDDYAIVSIGADGVMKPDASASLTVSGSWTNAGTFTHNNSLVTLDGTSQSLTGSNTFYKLTKSVTSADTMTFDNTVTQTITNTLTLNGASGQLLSLRSDSTGNQFGLVLSTGGTQSLSYLDVKDSDATGGDTLAAGSTSTNSGNNTNWTFGTTTTTTTETPHSGGSAAGRPLLFPRPGPKPIIIGDGSTYTNSRYTVIYFNFLDTSEMNLLFNSEEFKDDNWTNYVSQKDWDLGEKEDTFQFYVKGRSIDGFVSNPYSAFITLDTTAPVIPEIKVPASNQQFKTNSPTFLGETEPNSKVSLKIGQRLYRFETPAGGNWFFEITPPLPLGDYLLEARAEDWAGNTSPTVRVPFRIIKQLTQEEKEKVIPPQPPVTPQPPTEPASPAGRPGEEITPTIPEEEEEVTEEKPSEEEYIPVIPENISPEYWFKEPEVKGVIEKVAETTGRTLQNFQQTAQQIVRGTVEKVGRGLVSSGKTVGQGVVVSAKGVAKVLQKTKQGVIIGRQTTSRTLVIGWQKFSQGLMTGTKASENLTRIAGRGMIKGAQRVGRGLIAGSKTIGQRLALAGQKVNSGLMVTTQTSGQLVKQSRENIKNKIQQTTAPLASAFQRNMTLQRLAQITNAATAPFRRMSSQTRLALNNVLQTGRQNMVAGSQKVNQGLAVGGKVISQGVVAGSRTASQKMAVGVKITRQGVVISVRGISRGVVTGGRVVGQSVAIAGKAGGQAIVKGAKGVGRGAAVSAKTIIKGLAFVSQKVNDGLKTATQTSGQLARKTRADLFSKIKGLRPTPEPSLSTQLAQQATPEEIPTLIPKNLPQDVVVVKSRKGNLNLARAGSVNLIAGMKAYSFIRPSVQANKVIARLLFNQTLSQEDWEKILKQNQQANNFNLNLHLIKTAQAATPVQALEWQVLEKEYQPLENNIYMAELDVPQVPGVYTLQTEVELPDGVSKIYDLKAEINSRGYVYEAAEREETRLSEVKLILYSFNTKTNQFEIWLAASYDQANPQLTRDNGEYFFLVPAGRYYLTAEKKDYKFYQSPEFTLIQASPLNEKIKLEYQPAGWFKKLNPFK